MKRKERKTRNKLFKKEKSKMGQFTTTNNENNDTSKYTNVVVYDNDISPPKKEKRGFPERTEATTDGGFDTMVVAGDSDDDGTTAGETMVIQKSVKKPYTLSNISVAGKLANNKNNNEVKNNSNVNIMETKNIFPPKPFKGVPVLPNNLNLGMNFFSCVLFLLFVLILFSQEQKKRKKKKKGRGKKKERGRNFVTFQHKQKEQWGRSIRTKRTRTIFSN